jgi:outer membrane receptor protein involved in Fe transport
MRKNTYTASWLAFAAAWIGAAGTAQAQVAEAAAEVEPVDEIVVRGVFVPDEKRATSEISNVLDAEDFARTGDSDIASALRRVSGLAIAEGKFAIVRGLNERYSSTTLNGVTLPSPEPLRRAAPLDLFPTSILSGTLVQKTFSPQFSAEFGGGLIELRSVSIPDEDFLELGIGFSANTETTLRDGLFHEGSDTDVLGFDDGLRDFPDEFAGLSGNDLRSLSREESDRLGIALTAPETLLITRDDVPGNGGGSLTAGKVFRDDGDVRIGSTIYVGYDNEWQNRDITQNRPFQADAGLIIDGADQDFDADINETRQNIAFNALATTGVEWGAGDHSVAATAFILRDTLKRSLIGTVEIPDVISDPLRQENTQFIERDVWQAQLIGEHLFPQIGDLEAAWRVAYGEGERDFYNRQTTFRNDDGEFSFFGRNAVGFNEAGFSDLLDQNLYAGLDLVLPLNLTDRPIELMFGGSYVDNTRDVRNLDFRFSGTLGEELATSRADLIFSEASFLATTGGVNVALNQGALFPDLSEASLEVYGAYLMADAELTDYLRVSAGVRYEDGNEASQVQQTGSDIGALAAAPIEEEYLLPAVTATWNPFGNFQFRAGFSQTIVRPQFRELAFASFVDPETNISFSGNPFLQNSEVDNFDVRAEWYFGQGQSLTLGAFFKDIENPIEQYKIGDDSGTSSFLNAPSAEIWGVEFEFERTFGLDQFLDTAFGQSHELVFKTNYTYTDSEVGADGEFIAAPRNIADLRRGPVPLAAEGFIVEGRPLQGQSDHLFNLQIGLENVDTGTTATLLTNYASERIFLAPEPTFGGDLPPVLERPGTTVDFVVSQNLELGGSDYTLGIELQNLTNEDSEFVRDALVGDEVAEVDFQRFDLGRTVAISLQGRF